ncbi:MAG TPA: contact-dependent growth inhibition system immunity protein [Gemmataceae bacterium]|nr:contact-dependent growth inhibition system immunity protein [Gemmataceae bacterium]
MAFQALSKSRQGVPLPKPEDNLVVGILQMANVKSWSAFMRAAKCISLELEDGRLSIVPHSKLGSKGALESISEKTIVMPADASPEEIGAAMEEAFTRCQ